jgi:preprotein translocase subunit SecG
VNIFINILLVLEVLVALLMMLVILMQRPKSEGLGAAFGGGVTENIFGAQTTNVLTTATTWLASIFFIIVLVLSILYAHRTTAGSAVRRELEKSGATTTGAPALPARPAATAAANAKPAPQNTPVATASIAQGAVGVVPPGPLVPKPAPSASARPTP